MAEVTDHVAISNRNIARRLSARLFDSPIDRLLFAGAHLKRHRSQLIGLEAEAPR